MSAAGLGPRRGGPDDAFPTPSWVTRRLLDAWRPRDGWLLEPAAGDGAIIRAATEVIGPRVWAAVECRATCRGALQALVDTQPASPSRVAIDDFLTWEPPLGYVDHVTTVITNPPFHSAEAFIRRARQLFPHADLVFLVRLGFLASEKRVQLWRDLGAPDVNVLPNRPSFTSDGGTDSSDYAWIVFPGERRPVGSFLVLPLTSDIERGKRRRRAA